MYEHEYPQAGLGEKKLPLGYSTRCNEQKSHAAAELKKRVVDPTDDKENIFGGEQDPQLLKLSSDESLDSTPTTQPGSPRKDPFTSDEEGEDAAAENQNTIQKTCEVYAYRRVQAGAGTSAQAQDECSAQELSMTVNLVVQGLTGNTMAEMPCSVCDTVYEVKQRLARAIDYSVSQQHLVLGQTHLKDSERLSTYMSACTTQGTSTVLTVSCVRAGYSSLASLLEQEGLEAQARVEKAAEQKRAGVPAPRHHNVPARCEPLHAAVVDYADSVMQHELRQSTRHMPRASSICQAVPQHLRGKLITWMVEAFDVLEFSLDLLYGTVLTLDRYVAMVGPVENSTLGVALLAAICTEMKLSNHDVFPQGHWQRLLHHLCQGRFPLSSILQMEHEVLGRLGFVVGVPTSLTFFTGLTLRIQANAPEADASRWIEVATMLLNITLLDPEIHYQRTHAVLAAGAISAALGVCGAPAERRVELMEDLAAYIPGSAHDDATVLACEEDILKLWSSCLSGSGQWSEFFPAFERTLVHRSFTPTRRLADLEALHERK